MYRTIILLFCFAAATLAGAELSLDANPENLSVRIGDDIYVINPHPIPQDRAWIMERNGDPAQRLWAEILTASPIPESRLQAPFLIMPSLGDTRVDVVENTPKHIIIRVEYWLSAFGQGHGEGIAKRTFAYGRLFAEFHFSRDIPGVEIKLELRCHGKEPFVVNQFSVHLGKSSGQSAPAVNKNDSPPVIVEPAAIKRVDGGFEFPVHFNRTLPASLKRNEALETVFKLRRK